MVLFSINSSFSMVHGYVRFPHIYIYIDIYISTFCFLGQAPASPEKEEAPEEPAVREDMLLHMIK